MVPIDNWFFIGVVVLRNAIIFAVFFVGFIFFDKKTPCISRHKKNIIFDAALAVFGAATIFEIWSCLF